jgi:hypothetical protein
MHTTSLPKKDVYFAERLNVLSRERFSDFPSASAQFAASNTPQL